MEPWNNQYKKWERNSGGFKNVHGSQRGSQGQPTDLLPTRGQVQEFRRKVDFT